MRWLLIPLIALLLSCLPEPVRAGIYVDLGIGWINEIEVVTGEHVSTFPIDSNYLVFRGGYKHNQLHLEFEAIGNEVRSFQTLKIYYRWELE